MFIMPRSFIATGVTVGQRDYIGRGGYGNIFKDEFRGTVVALYKNDTNNLVNFNVCSRVVVVYSSNSPFFGRHYLLITTLCYHS